MTVDLANRPWWRRLPRGLDGAAFWLAIWFALLWLMRLVLPGSAGTLAAVLQVLVGFALAVVAVPVIWRQVRRKMLWSLRNKLVLTYLLIGLAPIVLFCTLVLVAAYIAAGQFAIHLAAARLDSEMEQVTGLNALDARALEKGLGSSGAKASIAWPEVRFTEPELQATEGDLYPRLGLFRDGVTLAYPGETPQMGRTPLGLPSWATQLQDGRYHGMVLDGGELYLVAIRQVEPTAGRRYSVISSLKVDRKLMQAVALGLGRARLFGAMTGNEGTDSQISDEVAASAERGRPVPKNIVTLSPEQTQQVTVAGGTPPLPVNVLDLRVRFVSTIPVVNWDTGTGGNVPIEMVSRPSRLYRALLGASLSGRITRALGTGLVVLCVLFAAIEALALWMAARLSRTVTASVTDLYDATRRIDRGEFNHRIGVERDDQMAELSRSFNTMTGSLERLLKEQKEKERLQNEISIAQEVQANLFPLAVTNLPTLELHGVCRPARAVSGDYYDFLVFEHEGIEINDPSRITGVGLAIGDISGKGISAALLMATLHSAVRAYRLASEELLAVSGPNHSAARAGQPGGELFESPGRILALLNRHLYRSTQPEKYATLFLAHYDAASSRLTYSNAGQLPPLVLGRDGVERRLDCGGTVVGLLDGMEYEEDSLLLSSGDILVAYSDGVTEPENDFGDFGEERMMDVVRRYRNEPLHVISSQVMQALDAWIGAEEQPDDITLVLARQI